MDLGKLREIADKRTCRECGAVFETDEEGAALQKFADHSTMHQPTPGQWTEAYNKIQATKSKKNSEK